MHPAIKTTEIRSRPPIEPSEIKLLILKMRWVGMEDEAERLGHILASIAPAERAPIGPLETD